MFPIARKIHEKELKKENSYINKNLYIWSDTLYGGDNYLKFLLEKIESESIPTNLKEIQKRILTNTNESLEELRLMRAYFRAYKERRTEKLYYKSVSTTIFSLVIFVIQSILTGRITTENILESFHPYNSWGLILSILLIALYYFLLPHRGENRSTLIINILDECIEELKEKQKTKL